MLNKRTRLRVEMLEGREVPAVTTGTEEILNPPVVDAPVTEAPVKETPVTEAPVVEAPVTETPVVEAPVTEAPIKEAPVTEVPVVETPVTEAPVTEAPVESVDDSEDTDEVVTVTDVLDGDPAVPEVDLAASVTADKAKPSIGDVVTFKITVSNNGETPATNVQLNALLPVGVTFSSATPGQGSFDKETGDWTVGTVYPGGPVTLTLKAKVVETTEQVVSATITHSDMPDNVVENNSASKSVTPALAGVKITKTASSTTLTVGATVVYTIAVKNSGPGTARNLVIQDTLGSGLTFIRTNTPTRGVFNPTTQVWKIGKLPAGTTTTIRILATVKATGKLTSSVALVSGTGIDETRSRLEAIATVYGTKVNVPATWSYVTLGSTSKILPVPSIGKLAQIAPVAPTSAPVLAKGPSTVLTPKLVWPTFGL